MGGKKVGIAILVVGLVLIVVALLVKLTIVPGMAKWPDDADVTRNYEGTLNTLLNAEALQTMDMENLFLEEVPVTISRHVTTEEVEGSKAIVREVVTMSGPTGAEIQSTDKLYAIDRKTMESIADFSDNDIPEREGLVVNFPIGTEKEDQLGWVSDYQSTITATYVREEEQGGVNTYVFESSSAAQEIVDTAILANFPAGMDLTTFLALAASFDMSDMSAEEQVALQLLLATLPDPVPLKYTYEYDVTYWIEPTTGVVINVEKREIRNVVLVTEAMDIPLADYISVFDLEYQATDATISEAAQDAKDSKSTLNLYGTIVPYALIGIGVVLGVLGLVVIVRKE